ncbi:MAG: hypothetical protein AVO33_02215 [delta proteobacterium ML8_F1]|nr:MAG: hypothetical protein AVO33_02215 [delta proteobacterium ML8_F1]
MSSLSVFGIFTAGVLTFLSPCILPLMPLYLSYITGNIPSESLSTRKNLMISIGFVLGLMLVFSLFGLTATTLGRFLNLKSTLFRQVSGGLIVLFGIHHMGILRFNFLSRERTLHFKATENSFLNAFLLGVVFSFGWTPCVGPILGTILLLMANSLTLFSGVAYMVVFSLGFSLPFVITTLFLGRLFQEINLSEGFYRTLQLVTGLVIILMGVLVYLNYVNKLIFSLI